MAPAISFLLLAHLFAPSLSLPLSDAVDMTHVASEEDTLAWPTAKKFQFETVFRGDSSAGFYFETNNFCQSEHSGTHLDAPAHFSKGKWRSADIPIDRLAGPAAVVDISEEAAAAGGGDARLDVSDLEAWEVKNGRIPQGAVVVMNSGWAKKYKDRRAYFGYPEGKEVAYNNTEDLHFPGFHPDAAQWLVANRDIIGVVVDTPSVDFGQSPDFKTHQILFKANIWAIENAANVDELPPKGYDLYAMVYKLKEGSGGPARVFALPSTAATSSATTPSSAAGAFVAAALVTIAAMN